jgi:hypothetical protein
MEIKKKGTNFFFVIIAIITGVKLYKHFDFQNLKFTETLIDIIYLLTFLGSIFLLLRDFVKRPKP